MNLLEFLEKYYNGVEVATEKALSVRALADLIGVSEFRLEKWGSRNSKPRSDSDRVKLKTFFGIEDLDNISDNVLKEAIKRYPKGLADIKENEATREKHPHKNMGTNELYNEIKEPVNQIYGQGLDKEYKTVLSLSPRKKIALLREDNKINIPAFEKLLPSDGNKEGWLPFIANIENLIALTGERNTQSAPPNWPMESEDVIFNRGVNAEYSICAPPYDNMIPKVYPGEKIYISVVNKLNYRPAVPYLVCFTDKTAMIYYLSKGTKDNHVRLISHDKSYGEKEEDLNNIFCLFEIKPRI